MTQFKKLSVILLLLFYSSAVFAAPEELKESSLPLPQDLRPLSVIRILILKDKWSLKIQTPASYKLTDKAGNLLLSGKQLKLTEIKPLPKGIQVGSKQLEVNAIRITSPYEIKIGKYAYMGIIEIMKHYKSGKLMVVNEISLEEYLKGVLPREVNPNWPLDALKAQAVASRTYAIFHIIKSKNNPWALSSDVRGQVYRGSNVNHELSDAAVDSTRGQILTYQNAVFPAFFHATCGGATTSIQNVWNYKIHPSMQSVSCPFCKGTIHYKWDAKYTPIEIETRLAKEGYKVPGVKMIVADQIDESGRAGIFRVTGKNGTVIVPSNIFRMAMDPFRFKSTHLRTLERVGQHFVFRGTGWGHGVGLCQYGAKNQGKIPRHYKEILSHYYPMSELSFLPVENV